MWGRLPQGELAKANRKGKRFGAAGQSGGEGEKKAGGSEARGRWHESDGEEAVGRGGPKARNGKATTPYAAREHKSQKRPEGDRPWKQMSVVTEPAAGRAYSQEQPEP